MAKATVLEEQIKEEREFRLGQLKERQNQQGLDGPNQAGPFKKSKNHQGGKNNNKPVPWCDKCSKRH